MRDRLERLLSAVLTLAAVVIAVSTAYSVFGRPAAPQFAAAPEYIRDWRSIVPDSRILVGEAEAPVTILELADLECPACKNTTPRIKEMVAARGRTVSLSFVHFPLTGIHRFAMPAAQVAECAASEGRFTQIVDAMYRQQDSLGLKTWASFAAVAGVKDTLSVAACALKTTPASRIAAGVAFGTKESIAETPVLIINGWLYRRGISDAALDSIVKSASSVPSR
jgi:protein-disulfide isomerase